MMRTLLIVSVFVALSSAQVSDVWITTITSADFGSAVTFFCNTSLESNIPPNGSYPERWMFNDLENVGLGFNDSKRAVSDDGYEMTIYDVNVEDFGIYHCMMMTPEMEWYMLKLGLNVRGPYYEDLWQKYKTNTIVGLSAMFIFLACALATIFGYKEFQKRRPQIEPVEMDEFKDQIEAGSIKKSSQSLNEEPKVTYAAENKGYEQENETPSTVQEPEKVIREASQTSKL